MIEYLNICVTDINNNSFFVTLELSEANTYLVETKRGKGGTFAYSPDEFMDSSKRIVGETSDAEDISYVFEELCIKPLKGKKRFPEDFEETDCLIGNPPDEFNLDYRRLGKAYTHHVRGNTSYMPDSIFCLLQLLAGWGIVDKELLSFRKEHEHMKSNETLVNETNLNEDELIEVDVEDLFLENVDIGLDSEEWTDENIDNDIDEVELKQLLDKVRKKKASIDAALDSQDKDRKLKPYEIISIAAVAYSDVLASPNNNERVRIFKNFLKDFQPKMKKFTPLLEFSNNDLFGKIISVGKVLNVKVSELITDNLPDDVFYDKLMEFLCTDPVIIEDKLNGACALYVLGTDIRMPYQQIDLTNAIHVTRAEYNDVLWSMDEGDLCLINSILLYPHNYSYECASLLLAHIENHQNTLERVALVDKIIQYYQVQLKNAEDMLEELKKLLEHREGAANE